MKPKIREKVNAQLKVLGMRHSWEIIANIRKGTKYMKQIANETSIPYTTVQKRIYDMEQAGIVRVFRDIDHTTGKAIKKVRVNRFKINIDPYTIEKMVSGDTNFINI
jgi:predicted transcriptional regulator